MCTLMDMVVREATEAAEKRIIEIQKETTARVERETTTKVSYQLLDTFLKNSGKSLDEALLLFEFTEEDGERYKSWKAQTLN